MNEQPKRKKPSARPSAPSGGATRGKARTEQGREPDRLERSGANTSGIRLDLPILGPTIERRWDFYQPYLRVVGTYEPVGQPAGTEGQFLEEPLPKSMFGHVVADPGALAGRDARGWSCPPGGPCVWGGIV